ncbi:MAG: hypothetical protein ACE5E0_03160 [Terriglobia bacterium]
MSPLWSIESRKEAFDLMVTAWPNLALVERKRLLDTIVDGPPKEMFAHIELEKRQRIYDRVIYDRLKRLEEINDGELPEPGRKALANLGAKYPTWLPRLGEQAHFTVWHEAGYGLDSDFSVEDLAKLASAKLLNILRSHKSNREGLLDTWQYFSTSRPKRAIATLVVMSKCKGELPNDILRATLNGLNDDALSRSALAKRLFCVLDSKITQVASDRSTLRAACQAFGTVARQPRLPVTLGPFWSLWDRLFTVMLQKQEPGLEPKNLGWMTWALNRPVGVLADAAMAVLFRGKFSINQRLPEETLQKLERLIANGDAPARAARVRLSSRAVFLAAVDPDWMRENFAPYFDWNRSEDEAAALWDGFGWGGRVSLEVWSILKDSFLATFTPEHLKLLGDNGERLSVLLTAIALELPKENLPKTSFRSALRGMTPGGRGKAAKYLARRLQEDDADGHADRVWTETVAPFIVRIWPKERRFIEPESAQQFALAAIATREEFKRAVDLIDPLLTSLQHWHGAIYALKKSIHPDQHPRGSLQLTARLVAPDNVRYSSELRAVLNRIAAADPTLRQNGSFQVLDHGLQVMGL